MKPDDAFDIPSIGDTVAWRWYQHVIKGVVQDVRAEPTHIYTKGKIVTRNGTPENPAVIISHASGNDVIKLASELYP